MESEKGFDIVSFTCSTIKVNKIWEQIFPPLTFTSV